jgi:hypothetical protein
MGTDIHAHVELKIAGQWEHWMAPHIDRSYPLFEKLAGVRGDVKKAIVEPKGLPLDATLLTKLVAADDGEDAFDHSWLSVSEIEELEKWFRTETPARDYYGRPRNFETDVMGGYFLGNGYSLDWLKDNGVEDVRLVFWFL